MPGRVTMSGRTKTHGTQHHKDQGDKRTTKATAHSTHPCHWKQVLERGKVGANDDNEGQGRTTTTGDEEGMGPQ